MKTAMLFVFPFALATFALAFRFPGVAERYGRTVYPLVARVFALVNRAPFSLAEPLGLLFGLGILFGVVRLWRSGYGRWRRLVYWTWSGAGVIALAFVFFWGLNYARPSLAERSSWTAGTLEAEAILAAGERTAVRTKTLFAELSTAGTPTTMPATFEELNQVLDDAFRRIGLPGDAIDFAPVPVKRLASSTLLSHLGISGVFIPFTGEPSVNAIQPDAVLPIVVAHEKAHQRGVTDEGEANFAAFLACADPGSPPYVRYSAYLFATRYLIGAAAADLPRERVDAAWEALGDGPRADLVAILEFWKRYEGPAAGVARDVNDRYLKTMRVPGGVRSYGTVVTLLMTLDERGELVP